MMLHNGVDPSQTEGMSKGTQRSEGHQRSDQSNDWMGLDGTGWELGETPYL